MDLKKEKPDSVPENISENVSENISEEMEKKMIEMMDILCETGIALESLSRMCSVLKLGFESPDFADGKDAAACIWVIGQLLDYMGTKKISPEIFKW